MFSNISSKQVEVVHVVVSFVNSAIYFKAYVYTMYAYVLLTDFQYLLLQLILNQMSRLKH